LVGQEGMYPLLFARALALPVGWEIPNDETGSVFYDALTIAMVERGFETKSFWRDDGGS